MGIWWWRWRWGQHLDVHPWLLLVGLFSLRCGQGLPPPTLSLSTSRPLPSSPTSSPPVHAGGGEASQGLQDPTW